MIGNRKLPVRKKVSTYRHNLVIQNIEYLIIDHLFGSVGAQLKEFYCICLHLLNVFSI